MKSNNNTRNAGRKRLPAGEILIHVPTYIKATEINEFFNSGDIKQDRNNLGKLMSNHFDEYKNILLNINKL